MDVPGQLTDHSLMNELIEEVESETNYKLTFHEKEGPSKGFYYFSGALTPR